MTASPRPRTKPRKSIGDIAALPPGELDQTPEDLFIMVYPRKLRALIQEKQLTRAQVGALLILALRIDEHNECWPSRGRATSDAGLIDARHTSKLHQKLADKGVLTINEQRDQSHTFTLPDAFRYGGGKTPPGGVGKTPPGGWGNHTRGGGESRPEAKANKQIQLEEDSSNKAARSANADSEGQMRELKRLGVRTDAAIAIVTQYRHSTIQSVIEDANRKAEAGEIQNPAGWIVSAIQKRANQQITLLSSRTEQTHEHSEPRPRRPR